MVAVNLLLLKIDFHFLSSYLIDDCPSLSCTLMQIRERLSQEMNWAPNLVLPAKTSFESSLIKLQCLIFPIMSVLCLFLSLTVNIVSVARLFFSKVT